MNKFFLLTVLACNILTLQSSSPSVPFKPTKKKVEQSKKKELEKARQEIAQLPVKLSLEATSTISYKKALSATKDPWIRAFVYQQVLEAINAQNNLIMREAFFSDLDSILNKEFPKTGDQKASALLREKFKTAQQMQKEQS